MTIPAAAAQPKAGLTRLEQLIIVATMLMAILEVLDTTIVNVALPHMMGALGASAHQVTWVATAYIVAAAMVIPLTGFLEARVGRRHLLLGCIISFGIASFGCALANTLSMMVGFRIILGLVGAPLIPLSQAILKDTFPGNRQGMAMAIWGVGIMVAPVLGPTLGGYLTEHLHWRWIFYINLPICLISYLLTRAVITQQQTRAQALDLVGLLLMVTAIGSLELFLNQGNDRGWLSDTWILCLLCLCITSWLGFFIRSWGRSVRIIDFALFRDLQFSLCTSMMVIYAAALFSTLVIQPIMMEHFMHYTAMASGAIMAPRGLASALSMGLIGPNLEKLNSRWVVFLGIGLSALGTWMMSLWTFDSSTHQLIWPAAIQGFGMGLFFVPTAAAALSTIPPHKIAEASGLYSYGRMLGTSLGISLLSTYVSRTSSQYWHLFGARLAPNSLALQWFLHGGAHPIPNSLGAPVIALQVVRQAHLLAFIHGFQYCTLVFILLLPLVGFLHTKPVH